MTTAIVEDPNLRLRHRFRTVGDDREVETWIGPGGGVTPHVHPAQHERFEVLDGRVEFLGGRRWTEAGPGEVVEVPPGTRHAFRNRTDAEAHLRCLASPAMSLQRFLEQTADMGRRGLISRHGIPKGPRGLLEGALLIEEHREMVTLLAPLPPPAVQRLVMPPLARLARRRGLGG
jgi:mannose-6-phosphate isomerase-like protein (cupin superfamily)